MKTWSLKPLNMSNGFPLCTIYLCTPFSLLIYLFLFGSFLLFDGCVLSATLCLISTFPPQTNRLSDATSSVKLCLSHAGVRFDEIWPRQFKCSHREESEHPHPPLVSHFLIPHFTAFSKRRNFFRDIIWNPSSGRHRKVFYFLITLF